MATFHLETGAIDGALFTVAVPTAPLTQKLLIYAHGCRPEGIPLVADLNLTDPLYLRLLSQGWIVAMTSYRREGLIVRDALTDLTSLHTHIIAKYGPMKTSILEGESMGGAISTFMAERDDAPFNGVFAIGAALLVKEPQNPLNFTHRPKRPLLFLTNTDETHIIDEYSEPCLADDLQPATWFVARNGHCNVNHFEREKALIALLAWVENPKDIERFQNATHQIAHSKTSVFFDGNGAWGKVTTTDAWGDLWTTIRPEDLTKMGISYGMKFDIDLGGKRFAEPGRPFRITYGANSFLSANQGEWYAYDHADGYIVISANGYAQDYRATKLAAVDAGSSVYVRRPVGVGAALNGIPGGVEEAALRLK